MSELMDYGAIGYGTPPSVEVDLTLHRLVYQATHRGDGSRLPFMYRSFISFTFGGKSIEDFNLIVTTPGDRIERDAYAPFEDITSSYDILDGSLYWSTHYKSNTLNLTLSTDGIDLPTLDSFKNWFLAGITRELILAEHPNRAALARVSEPPKISLLPFEENSTVTLAGSLYLTKTTLYKGDIQLTFVMDSPHWYSIKNVMGEKNEVNATYDDVWIDSNGLRVNIFQSKDALKILLEDGIPLGSMILENMLLGDGAFAEAAESYISLTWSIADDTSATGDPEGTGARTEADNATVPYQYGMIAGATVDFSGNGISYLEKSLLGYFYYSGTAPSPVILKFTLTPSVDNNGYINCPYNSYSHGNSINKYNRIIIGCLDEQEFCFTTPNLLTSYNKVINILLSTTNITKEALRSMIRDNVRHPKVREWAVKVIDHATASNSVIASPSSLILNMSYMLKDTNGALKPITFTFNSETGEALGEFYYRIINSSNPSNWATYLSGTLSVKREEDVGDMLKSNYIVVRDRNYPTRDSGAVVGWKADLPQNSHYIRHDVDSPLTDISILYKNMYL